LGELCRLEEIATEDVLAAGDHYNDLAMLDGTYAKNTACPGNAIEPVKELVRRTQGYVAGKCWADGVAEALAFYGTGRAKQNASLEFPGGSRA
jgi:hydroxymethylpyrimidine pyrophosphatase-like HAD family hydrolase